MAWLERSLGRHAATMAWNRLRRWASGRMPGLILLVLCLVTALAPAAAMAPSAAAEASRLEAGARLFEAHCVGCHLNGGNVIRRGRTLKLAALEKAGLADPQAIARVAASGIGQMSGYASALGEEGAVEVGEWVWQQARADWPRSAKGVETTSNVPESRPEQTASTP